MSESKIFNDTFKGVILGGVITLATSVYTMDAQLEQQKEFTRVDNKLTVLGKYIELLKPLPNRLAVYRSIECRGINVYDNRVSGPDIERYKSIDSFGFSEITAAGHHAKSVIDDERLDKVVDSISDMINDINVSKLEKGSESCSYAEKDNNYIGGYGKLLKSSTDLVPELEKVRAHLIDSI
ncbi:hypothetical protein [Cobetia marina]|uniref:hypothetical protein n=1 Tax=Cobetia marina TaxID=28258 RepID=UPI003857CADF